MVPWRSSNLAYFKRECFSAAHADDDNGYSDESDVRGFARVLLIYVIVDRGNVVFD